MYKMNEKLEKIGKSVGNGALNIVHIFLIGWIVIAIYHAVIKTNITAGMGIVDWFWAMGINEIYTFIGSLAFVFFGITGLYDFLYSTGIRPIVPPFFRKHKERQSVREIEKMMEVYYKHDIDFIQKYEEQRMSYLVQTMGIKEKQFHQLNYAIIRARVDSARCERDVRQEAKKALLQKQFIKDLSKYPDDKRIYRRVDYYIDMYAALYDSTICASVVNLMARYMETSLKQKIEGIDYIIIPEGSNFLLGLEES